MSARSGGAQSAPGSRMGKPLEDSGGAEVGADDTVGLVAGGAGGAIEAIDAPEAMAGRYVGYSRADYVRQKFPWSAGVSSYVILSGLCSNNHPHLVHSIVGPVLALLLDIIIKK